MCVFRQYSGYHVCISSEYHYHSIRHRATMLSITTHKKKTQQRSASMSMWLWCILSLKDREVIKSNTGGQFICILLFFSLFMFISLVWDRNCTCFVLERNKASNYYHIAEHTVSIWIHEQMYPVESVKIRNIYGKKNERDRICAEKKIWNVRDGMRDREREFVCERKIFAECVIKSKKNVVF